MSENHRFVGSAKLISLLTLASRVLGVGREMTFSYFFGATPPLGDFRLAFQVPNLARKLFGEGALTSSFIPILTRTRELDGEDEGRRLAGGVLTMLVAGLTALLLLVEAGLFITGAALGWSHVLRLTAVMMPYMVLICVTAFLGGTLNVLNRFAAPAIAPMILNVVIIVAAWIAGRIMKLNESAHLTLIAYSVVFAGVLQLASQWVWLRAVGFRMHLNFDWSAPRVRKVMRLMVPLVFGASAIQFNTFADSLIAQFMVPDGRGLSVLGYAQYINHLPLGIFSTALATAIFPMLSRRAAANDRAGFAEVAQTGVRTTLFIALPAGVGLILIAQPLIRVLYEHGEFGPADTARVARALSLYCLGMWAYSLQQILVRAFFAMEDSRTPVRIAVGMLGLNFVLNIILVLTPLREAGVALATAFTGMIQAVLLAVALRKRAPHLRWRGVAVTTGKACVATLAMGLAVWVLGGDSPFGSILPSGDLLRLAVLVIVGAAMYGLMARLLGMKELGLILGGHQE